ncbi:hypothetical protein L915_10397, partial [Phytophthora nicotianae]
MPPSVTPADPKPQCPMPDASKPPLVEPAGLTPPLNDSAIPPTPSMAPPVPQRRAAKATPQDVLQPLNQPSVRASASAASSIGRPAATAKRSSATSRSSTKKRRT